MGKSNPKAGNLKSVTRGRPPLAKPQKPALSAKATRNLIRSHHTLRKTHAVALASNDVAKAASIEAEIEANGGLNSYQLASTLGQSTDRGGDSSKVLVEWLKPTFEAAQAKGERLRMLEIGTLSTENACSKIPCVDIDRIDLHSQAPGIREIDFMDLPIPETEAEQYAILSLSLVLNFVPSAPARGEMLRRIHKFLRTGPTDCFTSCLFFVLPLPCIENARYMNEKRLNAIMQSLGFNLAYIKKTTKLYYSLWRYEGKSEIERKFGKEELNPGRSRNNFSIVLQ
jgi:25S rRNA (adenine2142-N1)-methyltransferase